MKLFEKLFKNNKGLSLVELIATVAIMGLVSAGIGVAVVSASRNYSKGSTEVDLQQEVQNISNILNNLVVDSQLAANEVNSEGIPVTDSLVITAINGDVYKVYCDGTELKYSKYTYADGTTEGPYTLSEYVTSFTADAGEYGTTHTVHFNMAYASAVNDRTMDTSFTAMSRNAESGPNLAIAPTAAMVIDPVAVIEPNQTIEIPFDVLVSGDATASMTYTVSEISTVSGSYVTVDTALSNTNKKITIHAGPSEGIKLSEGGTYESSYDTIYITLTVTGTKDGANVYTVTQPVTVHIRRVDSLSFNGAYNNDPAHSYAAAGSTYTVTSAVTGRNLERFFALKSDDDYVPSDRVWVTSSVTGYNSGNVAISVYDSDNALVGSFNANNLPEAGVINGNPSRYFILEPGQYFKVKLNANMTSGDSIEFDAYAVHASYTDVAALGTPDTAVNKTNMKYDFFKGSFEITVGLFPPMDSGFKRGQKEGAPSRNTIDALKKDAMIDNYVDSYLVPELLASPTTSVNDKNWLSDNNHVNSIKNAMRNSNIHTATFYSIGSSEIPDNSAKSTNYYRFEDGYYWSQYRMISDSVDSPSYSLVEEMSKRLEPDKPYMLEFVAVLYCGSSCSINMVNSTISFSANTILWPYYEKLTDLGFGNTHNGIGYSFDTNAELFTGAYASYGAKYPISPMEINWIGVTSVDGNIGSLANPVVIGNGHDKDFKYDQAEWVGLQYQEYQNEIGGTVYKYNGSDWDKVGSFDWGQNYISNDGAFKIYGTNDRYTINTSNVQPDASAYDVDAVYRFKPNIKMVKRYIRDTDKVFSKTVYQESYKTYYEYLNSGYIYFKRANVSDFNYIDFSYNDGSGNVTRRLILDQNQHFTLPTKSSDGSKTITGWYTKASGGNKVDMNNTASQYSAYYKKTLYAHY